jgi:formate dehydrogenase subunit gamma
MRRSQVSMGMRVAPWRLPLSVLAAFVAFSGFAGVASAQNVRPPENAVTSGAPPMVVPERGGNYDIDMWTELRKGTKGRVSIPDKKAGVLVDSSGETFRSFRNGPLMVYGAYALGGIVALLALFYLVRGRIRVEHGFAGRTLERFTEFERTGHWLLATSFIILGLTGLNMLYGRDVLIPVIGKEAFASISIVAKWLHNYVAFAFMVGLLITFVVWVIHNIPHPRDLVWFARGGGLLGGGHPDAKKFNAGQKVLFWLVMLGGLSLVLSGLQLLLPFQLPLFAKTFAFLNVFGLDLPTQLSANEEQQFAASWHAIVALFLLVVIIAHIYIGTIGMEGAFDAMGSGQVDVNWAKEHHNLWAEEKLAEGGVRESVPARPAPAE